MNATENHHLRLPAGMHVFERGWLSANNILFHGTQETVLVDSGYLTHAPQTLALVQHVLQERPLKRVINTHLHSDHCGGNAALQAAYGCHISIPHAQADNVNRWDETALHFKTTGQQCPRFSFHDTLRDGDTLLLNHLSWQVLAAPGHDPHALIFYCAQEGILISGDALWEKGFGVIFPELEGDSGFAETRATLELISALDIRLVIPGHGAPFHHVKQALAFAFSRIDYLQQDPRRNAENSVKVLIKFLLLERQTIPLAELPDMMTNIKLLAECNRRYFHLSAPALADWCTAQLVRAGVARVTDHMLVNAP